MRYLLIILSVCFFITCFSQQQEEFNGPFPSWANVKTRFGARGDGRSDDTKAIQKGIDDLGQPGQDAGSGYRFTVLYLPAGTYCISSTLILKGKLGITIVGENPSNTIIKWTGPDADTMLWANGSAYFKISRLTWNADNHKGIEALGIHWKNRWNDGKTQSYAALNIEISDNIFTGNCKYGISGGTGPENGTNNNDSEIAIKRCLFQNCTEAGILITGYNALDYWIWDCRFFYCNIGINCRYGNYHAYRSYFKSSLQSDVTNTNGYYTSLRGCYSEGSRSLTVDSGASDNPFKRVYQANTIMGQTGIPIQFYHWGRMVFMDNVFDRSKDTGIHFFVKTGSGIISLNNTYRNKTPVNFTTLKEFRQYKDVYKTSLIGSSEAFLAGQDKTPPNTDRQVFEVPLNAGSSGIQRAIDAASSSHTKKSIVHFSPGVYLIDRPLLIPAHANIELLGDGFLEASVIRPAKGFTGGTAMISISGPSNTVIRELQLGSFTNTKMAIDAIQCLHADQPGSQAFIDQIYAFGNNALRAEGLDNLYIQKDNSFFADNDFISGGPLTQAGKGVAGLFGFGGQFAGLSLQNNATAVYKDCWWEGAQRLPLDLSGSGNLTIDGAMIGPVQVDSTTTVSVRKFNGKINLSNMYLQGGIDVSADNPELRLMLMNIHFYFTLDPLKFIGKNSSFQGDLTALTTQCFTKEDRRCQQINFLYDRTYQVSDQDAFVSMMSADDRRALPKKYEVKNSSASNFYISRTAIGDVNAAIRFTR